MSNLRQELQACHILHSRPFKETSIILDVFSEKQGRLSILAKGAKQARSPFKSILRPFAPLLLSWRGRTDLKLLTDAQINGQLFYFEGMRLFIALYINELLIRALQPLDPYKTLYQHYQAVLNSIADLNYDASKIKMSLRLFEFQLLSELGYAPDLTNSGDPKLALRLAIQRVLGDKVIHSRKLVKNLLLNHE